MICSHPAQLTMRLNEVKYQLFWSPTPHFLSLLVTFFQKKKKMMVNFFSDHIITHDAIRMDDMSCKTYSSTCNIVLLGSAVIMSCGVRLN